MNDAHGSSKNPDLPKAIARHEVLCTLDDVAARRRRSFCVRAGASHGAPASIEIITALTKISWSRKRMKMVHPFQDKEANMVLIEAVRGGKSMI